MWSMISYLLEQFTVNNWNGIAMAILSLILIVIQIVLTIWAFNFLNRKYTQLGVNVFVNNKFKFLKKVFFDLTQFEESRKRYVFMWTMLVSFLFALVSVNLVSSLWIKETKFEAKNIDFDQTFFPANKESVDKPIIYWIEYFKDWNIVYWYDLNSLIQNKGIYKFKNIPTYTNSLSLVDNYNTIKTNIDSLVKEQLPTIWKNKEISKILWFVEFDKFSKAKDINLYSPFFQNSDWVYDNLVRYEVRSVDEIKNDTLLYFDNNNIQKAITEWKLKILLNYWDPFTANTFKSVAINGWSVLEEHFKNLLWNGVYESYLSSISTKQESTTTLSTILYYFEKSISILIAVVIVWMLGFLPGLMNGWDSLKKSDILTADNLWDVVKMWGNEDLTSMIEEIIKLNRISSGAKLKGILLYWPPGTGKSLFWKQLAKKLNIWFKYLSAWIFQDKYVGGTQKRIKNLFAAIRKEIEKKWMKQCILFLDELDSIWENRDSHSWQYSKDWLNQILTEIDWFNSDDGIILVAATNRLESLDPALVSRFDYKVLVNLPQREARRDILKNHLIYLYEKQTKWGYVCIEGSYPIIYSQKNWVWTSKDFYADDKLKFVKDIIKELKEMWENTSQLEELLVSDNLQLLATTLLTTLPSQIKEKYEKEINYIVQNYLYKKNLRLKTINKSIKIFDPEILQDNLLFEKYSLLTEWMSWRDIKKVIDILYNKAIIEEVVIDDNLIWRSIEEFIIGKDKKNSFNKSQLAIIGYHEMGHAVIAKRIGKLVAQISIAAKSMSLGQTFSVNEEEKILPTKEDMINNILELMWGRAAELIFIWDITAWSSNDYERIFKIAKNYFLLNFSYKVKDENFVKERLWIDHVEDYYSMGYVCKYEDLSSEEKSRLLNMMKIMIADCEWITESIIKEEKATFEHYTPILIDKLVIFEKEFKLL